MVRLNRKRPSIARSGNAKLTAIRCPPLSAFLRVRRSVRMDAMIPASAIPFRLLPVLAAIIAGMASPTVGSPAEPGPPADHPLPPHPTLLLAETRSGPLPVVAAEDNRPVVVIEGARRALPVSTRLIAERGARYPAVLAAVETRVLKRTPVIMSELSGRRTTAVEFTVEALVRCDQDLPDCYLVILSYDSVCVSDLDRDPASSLRVREVGALRAGEPRRITVEFRVTDPERVPARSATAVGSVTRMETCFQLFSGGVEVGTPPPTEAAAFYHSRERAALRLAIEAWKKGNLRTTRPAQPFLQIPPLLGSATLPASGAATLRIAADGTVTEVSLDPAIPDTAVGPLTSTLQAWLFLPALKDGVPAASRARLPLTF
jgi:hypothetical protein